MADLNSQALPFQIRVLDGPLAAEPLGDGLPAGVVHLGGPGRSGPRRPISFDQEMRQKTSFYPGNPEGTQQVIGLSVKPTTIGGKWMDRYLGDGRARLLVDLFERILRSGSSLEVSWGTGVDGAGTSTEGAGYVRVGVLSNFKYDPDRPQDVEWSMTFTWRGTGDPSAPATTATAEVNPRQGFADAVGDTKLARETFVAYRDQRLFPITAAADRALSLAITDIDSATDAIQQVTSVVTSAVNFPPGAARALVAAVSLAMDAEARLARVALDADPAKLLLPTDDAIALLRAKDDTFVLLDSCDAARESGRRAREGVEGQILPEVIAEVFAPAGVDLRDLALRFYGDPDAWFAIADFNDLATSEVLPPPSGPSDRPPDPIRIPRLQAGPQSDLRQNC